MKGKEYPDTFAELEKMFKSDSDCYDYRKKLRWPVGFICPKCGSRESWSMGNDRVLCAKCRWQQSVLSGTVMHRTHLPVKLWFRAMWCICASKSGVSALNLKHTLGIGSYNTAWLCLHKLRRAMVRPGRELLSGVVEADETYVGAPQEGKPGRGAYGKRLVFVAVERKGKGIGRIRMQGIANASGEALQAAVTSTIEPRSSIKTDGWSGYNWMGKSDYRREKVNDVDEEVADCVLPKCHLVISLFKRWMAGTLQGNIGRDHLGDYLNEFVFRFNRRTSRSRGLLFHRLAGLAMAASPNPRTSIIGGGTQDVV